MGAIRAYQTQTQGTQHKHTLNLYIFVNQDESIMNHYEHSMEGRE
jgi:hypothetical protein